MSGGGHSDTSRPWKKENPMAQTKIGAKDPKAVKRWHGDKKKPKPRRLTMAEEMKK